MNDSRSSTTLQFNQEQFDEFARLSGDDNPIHVDEDFSARTRFGRTVAHGMFIFANFNAALARRAAGPMILAQQSLVFTGPTFTGERLTIDIEGAPAPSFSEKLTDASGDVTSHGVALVAARAAFERLPRREPSDVELKGMHVGMSRSGVRTITKADVADFLDLVGDPNPVFVGDGAEVPPALVGGMVSWLLGVELPGRGTNWLKQRYSFHEPVPVDSEITTTVTISRLRPEKDLVNLDTVCDVGGRVVASGETLVFVRDTEAH